MTGRPTRLVRVIADGTGGDFAVSADSTVGQLAVLLAGALGLEAADESWRLILAGRELPVNQALLATPVHDGDELVLTRGPLPTYRDGDSNGEQAAMHRQHRFGTASG